MKLVLTSSNTFSLGNASKIPINPNPALFTNQSTFPNFSNVAAKADSIVEILVTSHFVINRREASRDVSSVGALCGDRIDATTFHPSLWKVRAVARPIPEDAPVINTVFGDIIDGAYQLVDVGRY